MPQAIPFIAAAANVATGGVVAKQIAVIAAVASFAIADYGHAATASLGELAVIGFSIQSGAVVSQILVPSEDGGIERFELATPWLNPSDESSLASGPLLVDVATVDQAACVMRQQVDLYRSAVQPGLGAPFVVATVTRDRVSIHLIP